MNLVDTSVWVAFFKGDPGARALAGALADDAVLGHPWIVGELALGALGRRRDQVLADLGRLPQAPVLDHREMLALVAARGLAGAGIGWVDAQLVGSALIAGASLWTLDRRLAGVATRLGIARFA